MQISNQQFITKQKAVANVANHYKRKVRKEIFQANFFLIANVKNFN